jgi:hypothetical protein
VAAVDAAVAKIEPYRLNPVPPTVALLDGPRTAVDEHGATLSLPELERGVRVFASWDLVHELVSAGYGETYCWDGEPIRWRHEAVDDGPIGWTRRHTDVTVFRMAFPPEPERVLSGLAIWRDWLGEYGAAPQGSLGSSAMSLLRGTIGRPLWTARGQLPPIRWTMGGRQELLTEPRSTHAGARHFDLPAAYARTLGELRYGGVWRQLGPGFDWRFWHGEGRPVFVRADVRVPRLRFGPLPRRPRKRPAGWDRSVLAPPIEFPVGKRLRGTWTVEELAEAERLGADVRALEAWVHVTEGGDLGRPFTAWWAAVQDGRSRPGFAGLLAKGSANALWGQFCVSEGRRELRGPGGSLRVLPAPGGGMPRSWDLAELVTGRVRAALAGMMRENAGDVLSVHTDGGWMANRAGIPPDGWAVKDEAARLELLGPQTLRYRRPRSGRWLYCVSGVPPSRAEGLFESAWRGAT